MARKRAPSRGTRWADAVARARSAADELSAALEELREVQSEYSDWRDNLTDNLRSTSVGEKLDVVADLDLEPDVDSIINALDEAESADLPLGFGRD